MKDASKRKTLYEYDNNGNLVKLTDRNKVATTYLYDGLDRLVEKHNSKDGSKTAIKITYDKLGATRQMKDASGTTVFDYDNLGRLTTINYGNGINQKYTYDNADRINRLEVLQGNLKQMNLKYQYDKVGRLTRVSDNGKNFTYKYDAAGKLVEELNGVTGIRSDYRYYPSGNIKSLRHFNGKDITSSYQYRYDARGNQIQKDEGNGTTKYFYDPLSRIKTAMLPDSIQNYEYDDLDNIKELTEIKGNKIEETSYQYDRDSRLLLQETQKGDENSQKRFTYDNVGNQLTKEEVVKRKGNFITSKNTTFDYNGFNQVERVKNPDGQFIEYTYNGNGLRTKKDFGDRAVNYYYDGGNIIMETDQDSRVTAKNIRGLRLISRENNPGQTNTSLFYYLHNAHGDVTQLVDEKGQVIKDYRYDPFGNEEDILGQAFGGKQSTELWRQEVEKIDNPFRYAGEYLDEETGNYYLRARYYDPSIQRFINEDSYGVERGAGWSEHWYNYAGNNPIRFTDPSGHKFTGYTKGAEKRIAEINKQITELGKQWRNTSNPKKQADLHAKADKLRIEKKQVIYWDPNNDDGSRRILQKEINDIRKEHNWSYNQTQFYNPKLGIDPYGIAKSNNDTMLFSKTRHSQSDSGLRDLSDDEVSRRARDKSLSSQERRRYQTEEKYRDLRNKNKRKEKYKNQIVPEESPIIPIPALVPKGGVPAPSPAYGGVLPLIVPTELFDEFCKEIRFTQPT